MTSLETLLAATATSDTLAMDRIMAGRATTLLQSNSTDSFKIIEHAFPVIQTSYSRNEPEGVDAPDSLAAMSFPASSCRTAPVLGAYSTVAEGATGPSSVEVGGSEGGSAAEKKKASEWKGKGFMSRPERSPPLLFTSTSLHSPPLRQPGFPTSNGYGGPQPSYLDPSLVPLPSTSTHLTTFPSKQKIKLSFKSVGVDAKREYSDFSSSSDEEHGMVGDDVAFIPPRRSGPKLTSTMNGEIARTAASRRDQIAGGHKSSGARKRFRASESTSAGQSNGWHEGVYNGADDEMGDEYDDTEGDRDDDGDHVQGDEEDEDEDQARESDFDDEVDKPRKRAKRTSLSKSASRKAKAGFKAKPAAGWPGAQENFASGDGTTASSARREGDATFVCPECGDSFTRLYNLKGHQRSHRNEKPYFCSHAGCGKSFARPHDCKRHELLHVGKKLFKCVICSKNFARLDALQRHHRSESGRPCQLSLSRQSIGRATASNSIGVLAVQP